jgi:hypothetical protein
MGILMGSAIEHDRLLREAAPEEVAGHLRFDR